MTGTKSVAEDVFAEFYQKIKSGEMVAPTYSLTFTEKTTGAVYYVSGSWAGKEMVTLRTGTYKVVGTSTAVGDNIQDKCSLKFEQDITIDMSSTAISLNATYDCFLIVFSDASISKMSNYNGLTSTDMFKFNNYLYAFENKNLYTEGKQTESYLEGTHKNDGQFKIYTGNLEYKKGKYYVYNDVNASFDLDKMTEGGQEGFSVNLSAEGTANCYIVPSAGAYRFRANVKGNSDEPLDGTPVKAEVLWETFNTDIKPSVGDIVNNVSIANNYIYFKSTGTSGNAVIAVSDSEGKILWSWHIWACNGFDPVATQQVYNNNAGIMMDRNLGALSATPGDVQAFGLMYQWGRKDPFLGPSSISSNIEAKSTISWPSTVSSNSSTGTIAYAVAHPTTFITNNSSNDDWYYTGSSSTDNTRWTSSKGIYDPCPKGWRVPDGGSSGVWSKAFGRSSSWTTSSNWDSTNKGMDFGSTDWTLGTGSIWYPAAGYRYPSDGAFRYVVGGYCWSCMPNGSYAYSSQFDYYGRVEPSSICYRADGRAVRCLSE